MRRNGRERTVPDNFHTAKVHSLTHSHTNSLTLTHSRTYSLTYSLTHSYSLHLLTYFFLLEHPSGGHFPEEGWGGKCGNNEVTCHLSGFGAEGKISFDWKHFTYEDYDEWLWSEQGVWNGNYSTRRPDILTVHVGLHTCFHAYTDSPRGQVVTYSLAYSLTYSLTHLLTHSLTHSLAYSLTHLLTYT
jgi:hypothetical protein